MIQFLSTATVALSVYLMRPDPNKPTHQKDDGNGRNKRVYKQKPPERGFLREQLISANNLLKAARD